MSQAHEECKDGVERWALMAVAAEAEAEAVAVAGGLMGRLSLVWRRLTWVWVTWWALVEVAK